MYINTSLTFVLGVSLLGIMPLSIIALRSICPDSSTGKAGGLSSETRKGAPGVVRTFGLALVCVCDYCCFNVTALLLWDKRLVASAILRWSSIKLRPVELPLLGPDALFLLLTGACFCCCCCCCDGGGRAADCCCELIAPCFWNLASVANTSARLASISFYLWWVIEYTLKNVCNFYLLEIRHFFFF